VTQSPSFKMTDPKNKNKLKILQNLNGPKCLQILQIICLAFIFLLYDDQM